MMDGHDLRKCAGASMPSGAVYFKDKDGGIHPVESFMCCRNTGFGAVNLLLESGKLVADFDDLVPGVPPQELTDYLNELYEQEKNKKSKIK